MSGTCKLLIGLTGGIGAGKTTAAQRFSKLGAFVLDADSVSRASLAPGGACFSQVLEAFGTGIQCPDGGIDRAALSRIVFSDPAAREKLNAIVHPHVIDSLLSQARAHLAQSPCMPVVLDVPLLFECGMERDVDVSVLVAASERIRVTRICARDGAREADALARIRAQMPQTDKERLADYVLYNDGPVEALLGQTDAMYQRVLWQMQA